MQLESDAKENSFRDDGLRYTPSASQNPEGSGLFLLVQFLESRIGA
jgi:hypothetical protein